MAADKIKYMRDLIKDRLGKVREKISEEAYLLYCSMVEDCDDFEELKKMADIEMQIGYIEYINQNIVKRLKEIGYDLDNVAGILSGFCGINYGIDLSSKEVEREDIFDVRDIIMGEDEDLQNEIMASLIREMTSRMESTPEGFVSEDGVRPGQKCLIQYYDEVEAEKGEKDLDSLLNNMMDDEDKAHSEYVDTTLVSDTEEELGIDLSDAFEEIDSFEAAFSNSDIDSDGEVDSLILEEAIDDIEFDETGMDFDEDGQGETEGVADIENLGELLDSESENDGFSLDDLMGGNISLDEEGSDEDAETDFEALIDDSEFSDDTEESEDGNSDELDFDSMLGDEFEEDDGGDPEQDLDSMLDELDVPEIEEAGSDGEDFDFDSLEDGLEDIEEDAAEDDAGDPDFDNMLEDIEMEDEPQEEDGGELDFESMLGDEDAFEDEEVDSGNTDFDSLLGGDALDGLDDAIDGLDDALDGLDDIEEDGGDVDFDSLLPDEPNDSFDSLFDSVTNKGKAPANRLSLSEAIEKNIPDSSKASQAPAQAGQANANTPKGQIFSNTQTQKSFDIIANAGKKIEGIFKGTHK